MKERRQEVAHGARHGRGKKLTEQVKQLTARVTKLEGKTLKDKRAAEYLNVN